MENEYIQPEDSNSENLLNQKELIRELIPLKPTTSGKRFTNYIIDLIFFYFIKLGSFIDV